MVSQKGQALAESIICLPVLIAMVLVTAWFSRLLLTRQQLLSAARYGTDMIVHTTLNENEIRQEIRNYLSHRWIKGRTLDPAKLKDENIRVSIRDFPEIRLDAKTFIARPDKLASLLKIMLAPLNETSSVEIFYEFDTPAMFRAALSPVFSVSARSEVLSGTGCSGAIHNRNKS